MLRPSSLARLRLDLRQQVIRHPLLACARVVEIGMDVTGMRVAVLGTLRLVIGQGPLMDVRYLDLLIGVGDPAMSQRVRRSMFGEQLRLARDQFLLLKVTAEACRAGKHERTILAEFARCGFAAARSGSRSTASRTPWSS